MRRLSLTSAGRSTTPGPEVVGAIGRGLCVLVGVTHDDTAADAEWIARKVWNLRVFDDEAGVMNRSASEVGAGILVVSQFTLYGDAIGGSAAELDRRRPPGAGRAARRPCRRHAARPRGQRWRPGGSGRRCRSSLVNDGPVTVLLESPVHHVAARPTIITRMIGPSPRRVYHVSPARNSTVVGGSPPAR